MGYERNLEILEGVLGQLIYSLEYEGNKASDKRLDSYFKEERKETKRMMMMNDIGKETGTRWSLIETKSAKNRDRKRKDARKM